MLKENGHPDFAPFFYKGTEGQSVVTITLTKLDPAIIASKGKKAAQAAARKADDAAANAAAGFTNGTPPNHSWHHSEELGRMELVEIEAHRPFAHNGGRAIFEELVDRGIIP